MAIAARIVYSLIPRARSSEMADVLLKNYYSYETVSSKLGLFTKGTSPLVKEMHQKRIERGTSYFAQDEQTKRIVGVIISGKYQKWDSEMYSAIVKELRPQNPEAWDRFVTYLNAYMNGYDSVEEMLGVQTTYRLFDMFVNPEYRKFGIGRELLRLSVEQGKASDTDAVTGTCTTKTTFKLLQSMGFEAVSKVSYKDVLYNGIPIIDDPDAFVALMARRKTTESS